MMFHMANCMRILSAQYNVVFVLSNQVTGNFNGDAQQQQQGINSSSAFKPALGLSWSNCINQRYVLPPIDLDALMSSTRTILLSSSVAS